MTWRLTYCETSVMHKSNKIYFPCFFLLVCVRVYFLFIVDFWCQFGDELEGQQADIVWCKCCMK